MNLDLQNLVRRIWRTAYMESEEQHARYIQEYVSAQLEEQQKEIERLKIELSNYAYQMDMAKRDRDKAEHELLKAKEENDKAVLIGYYDFEKEFGSV